MTDKIFTIGFTKKKAQQFFELLKTNNVQLVLDIRLNNSSQLSAFAKYPDIQYFTKELCSADYKHDTTFSPTESILKRYKKKEINWEQYVKEFLMEMKKRDIKKYISDNYSNYENICLLCSEATAEHCHRSLVAKEFQEVFDGLKIKNI